MATGFAVMLHKMTNNNKLQNPRKTNFAFYGLRQRALDPQEMVPPSPPPVPGQLARVTQTITQTHLLHQVLTHLHW